MRNFCLILSIFIIVIACEEDKVIIETNFSQYQTTDSVSSEIVFYPVELYESYEAPDTPSLKMNFKTTKIYPCINYHLATTQFTNFNELIVRFDSVQEFNICFTAIGPAETTINLPENITRLVLINGQKIDKYQIDITDKKVDISLINKSFTNVKYNKIFRYPENSFAYTCGTNLNNKHIYNDFLNILLDSTSITEFEFNGEGKIPYSDSSSGHWSDNASKFFKYTNESDFDKAGELLKNFSKKNISPNDGVTISLTSWNNRKYMSWYINY